MPTMTPRPGYMLVGMTDGSITEAPIPSCACTLAPVAYVLSRLDGSVDETLCLPCLIRVLPTLQRHALVGTFDPSFLLPVPSGRRIH